MADDAVLIVHAWHSALNRGDLEALISLSTEQIEVGGPRGRGTGPARQLLREWFERARVQLEPHQTFHRRHTVVVDERAIWQRAEANGENELQAVASVFTLENGRVASVVRYPDLASALDSSGLSVSDAASNTDLASK
jgi:ketosteroid isomerase-like protein